MAKFLPFVVEKSTPLHIYQTLISRSKGLNDLLVTSIFYLVVEKGIIEVREAASKIKEANVEYLYEQLINAYPSYRIPNSQFIKIHAIEKFVKKHASDMYSEELKEYEISDVINFLLVMVLTGRSYDYTELSLEKLFEADSDRIYENLIDLGLFASDGLHYVFRDIKELKAYVDFHGLVLPNASGVGAVKAILDTEDSAGYPVGQVPYPESGIGTPCT